MGWGYHQSSALRRSNVSIANIKAAFGSVGAPCISINKKAPPNNQRGFQKTYYNQLLINKPFSVYFTLVFS